MKRPVVLLLCVSCTSSVDDLVGIDVVVPQRYEFEGADYRVATAHQVLVQDLGDQIGLLTHELGAGAERGEVVARLERLFSGDDETIADLPHGLTTQPPAQQTSYGELAASFPSIASLVTTEEASKVRGWFQALDEAAVARRAGEPTTLPIHVTADGVDIQHIATAFLTSAVSLNRAVELASSAGSAPEWDLAFGYYGASIGYGTVAPERLTRGAHFTDLDADGRIDLGAEYNFGSSVRAAERDADSRPPSTFMADTWNGFLVGRATAAQFPNAQAEITDAKDKTIAAWEAAIAATVIHHLNGALSTVCRCGDAAYVYDEASFLEHAEDWSAMSGHALALTRSPTGRLTQPDSEMLRRLLGPGPVHDTPGSESALEAYKRDLVAARSLLGAAYRFDVQNLGDEGGESGW